MNADENSLPQLPAPEQPSASPHPGNPSSPAKLTRPIWVPELNPDGSPRHDYTQLRLPPGEAIVQQPKVAVCGPPGPNEFTSAATMSRDGKPVYILGSGPVQSRESAAIFLHDLGHMGLLFRQGSKIVEIVTDDADGTARLEEVTVSGLRTRVEKLGVLYAYRKRDADYQLAAHARCSEEMAKALHECDAKRKHLPQISVVVNCPLITDYGV